MSVRCGRGCSMTALPIPRQTLSVLGEILSQALDAAERLELAIAEATDELRDCNQDWRSGTLTLRLTALRNEQARHITQAAQSLRSIERLRAANGMGQTVLGRVFQEYAK